MDAQQQPCSLGNGRFVVGDAGAVRRADFTKDCARFGHDIWNSERTADLDQLAARDNHFPALGQRVQR